MRMYRVNRESGPAMASEVVPEYDIQKAVMRQSDYGRWPITVKPEVNLPEDRSKVLAEKILEIREAGYRNGQPVNRIAMIKALRDFLTIENDRCPHCNILRNGPLSLKDMKDIVCAFVPDERR